MSLRSETHFWLAHRASAALLGICAVVHLVTMIYAIQGGLSAAEILGRTRGNVLWLAFYSVFVLAVVVHVPIGLRAVFTEWFGWRGKGRDAALLLFAGLLAWLGIRAVAGVFL